MAPLNCAGHTLALDSNNSRLFEMDLAYPSPTAGMLEFADDVYDPWEYTRTPEDDEENPITIGIAYLASELDDYTLKAGLGKGGSGDVKLALRAHIRGSLCTEPAYAAVKVIRRMSGDVRSSHLAKTELQMLQKVRAAGNMAFIQLEQSFSDIFNWYLVLEYIPGGTLWDLIDRAPGGKLEAVRLRFITAELVSALAFLHKINIIHRDLKEDNILIDVGGHTVISDFGLALDETAGQPEWSRGICGTQGYMAPEMLRKKSYSYAIDCWALGVMVYHMRWGYLPFDGDSAQEVSQRTNCEKQEYPNDDMPSYVFKQFLEGLLEKNPKRRLSMESAKKCAYLQGIDWERVEARDFDVPAEWIRTSNPAVIPTDKVLSKSHLVDKNIAYRLGISNNSDASSGFNTSLHWNAGKRNIVHHGSTLRLFKYLSDGWKLKTPILRKLFGGQVPERDARKLFRQDSLACELFEEEAGSYPPEHRNAIRGASRTSSDWDYERLIGASSIPDMGRIDSLDSVDIIIGTGCGDVFKRRKTSAKPESLLMVANDKTRSTNTSPGPLLRTRELPPIHFVKRLSLESANSANSPPVPQVHQCTAEPAARCKSTFLCAYPNYTRGAGLGLLNVPDLMRSQSTITSTTSLETHGTSFILPIPAPPTFDESGYLFRAVKATPKKSFVRPLGRSFSDWRRSLSVGAQDKVGRDSGSDMDLSD